MIKKLCIKVVSTTAKVIHNSVCSIVKYFTLILVTKELNITFKFDSQWV
jgi:hypothetical protein